MTSTLSKVLSAVGWTGVYVGLVVAGASAIFVSGPPTQGCYPGCVGRVEPTLAIAGGSILLAGIVLAAVGSRIGRRQAASQ